MLLQVEHTRPLDTFLRMQISGIHITLVVRFIKDMTYLMEQLARSVELSMAAAPEWSVPDAPTNKMEGTTGCFLLEVDLSDFTIDIPRCSWSRDFYSICGARVGLVLSSYYTLF